MSEVDVEVCVPLIEAVVGDLGRQHPTDDVDDAVELSELRSDRRRGGRDSVLGGGVSDEMGHLQTSGHLGDGLLIRVQAEDLPAQRDDGRTHLGADAASGTEHEMGTTIESEQIRRITGRRLFGHRVQLLTTLCRPETAMSTSIASRPIATRIANVSATWKLFVAMTIRWPRPT